MRTSENKPIQVAIRLSEAELAAVMAAAKQEGFYISQWIRYAIRQFLKSQGVEIGA